MLHRRSKSENEPPVGVFYCVSSLPRVKIHCLPTSALDCFLIHGHNHVHSLYVKGNIYKLHEKEGEILNVNVLNLNHPKRKGKVLLAGQYTQSDTQRNTCLWKEQL